MRHRIAGWAAIALLSGGTIALAPVSPAGAHTDVCAGVGTKFINPGLLFPLSPSVTGTTISLAGSTSASFSFSFGGSGLCALGGGTGSSGTLNGYCGHVAGQGSTPDGHRFGFVSAGVAVVYSGAIPGLAFITPDTLAGSSCTTGATNWIVTRVGVLLHCNTAKTKSSLLQTLLAAGSVTPALSLTVSWDNITAHHYAKICI